MARSRKKIPLEAWRLHEPPWADAVPLCHGHYLDWRDGEREGPAAVVDMQDAGEEPCALCALIVSDGEGVELRPKES